MAETWRVTQLRLSPDGRTAENWNPYQMQVRNVLADKKREGLYLDQVLLNHRGGVQPSDPGSDVAKWIGEQEGRT